MLWSAVTVAAANTLRRQGGTASKFGRGATGVLMAASGEPTGLAAADLAAPASRGMATLGIHQPELVGEREFRFRATSSRRWRGRERERARGKDTLTTHPPLNLDPPSRPLSHPQQTSASSAPSAPPLAASRARWRP